MKPATRVALALAATFAALGLALAYPYLARQEAWSDAILQSPWMLLWLAAAPIVFVWGIVTESRRRPRLRIGTVAPLVSGPRGARTFLRDVPTALRTATVVLIAFALARPVSVLRDQHTSETGIDIVIVLDLSGSMRAVLDGSIDGLEPEGSGARARRPTRLDAAKFVIKDFISRRKTDRIGVVVFGKTAYVLSPPTLDYALLTQMVSKMSLNVIDGSGTAIGDALGTGVARLRRSDARSKTVVLLTDGDSNAGSISPDYAAGLAKKLGVKVYAIQIGTGDEVDVEDGVDLLGQPRYVRQRFPVNPELLKRIAQETGGETFVATDGKALQTSMHAVLDSLEKTSFEASITSFDDLFPLLVAPAVFLIALDALLRASLLRRLP